MMTKVTQMWVAVKTKCTHCVYNHVCRGYTPVCCVCRRRHSG